MEDNSGSNRASNFKSADHIVRGRFEITSMATPEFYDMKSNLPINRISNKMRECLQYLRISFYVYSKHADILRKSCIQWRKNNSVQMIDARIAKLSDYNYPITKSSNWTAVIGYPCNRTPITKQIGTWRTNHNQVFCYTCRYE